jgi:hypothetical protein
MKLSIKDINRSQAIYKMLCQLDEQIIKLDKRAIELTDNNQPVKLSLEFVSNKPTKEVVDDEDDYMVRMNRILSGGLFSPNIKKKTSIDIFEQELSDTEALNLIGMLIAIKKTERAALVKELINMGFDINH